MNNEKVLRLVIFVEDKRQAALNNSILSLNLGFISFESQLVILTHFRLIFVIEIKITTTN